MTDGTATATATESSLLARCLRCEYNLRGLPRNAKCPECGTPVEPSWRRAEVERAAALPPLELSSASWLRGMGIACCLMIASALLTAFEAWRIVGGSGGGDNWGAMPVVLGLSHLGATLAGLWMFGAREPLRPQSRPAGAGGGRASRYTVRAMAVASAALPFAMLPLMNRFMGVTRFYDWMSVAFATLAGVATWVAMRRLAAAARRDTRRWLARAAAAIAWIATPLWVAHAAYDSSILVGGYSWWHLNAHPIAGYTESVVAIPLVVAAVRRWDDRFLPWVPEALVSLASVLVLAGMARLFFTAASRSASRSDAGA